jgi:hypothetical protein
MSALLFGCRDIHGRILAREPGGPRKGAAIRLPLERESMALDRSKRPPRSGHGRPPFWERPSLTLPDLWEPRRGCANYAPLGGAVNANGDRGSLVAPGPVALVLRPGWLQTAARSPLLIAMPCSWRAASSPSFGTMTVSVIVVCEMSASRCGECAHMPYRPCA